MGGEGPKIRGTLLEFWGLYLGFPVLVNCHVNVPKTLWVMVFNIVVQKVSSQPESAIDLLLAPS